MQMRYANEQHNYMQIWKIFVVIKCHRSQTRVTRNSTRRSLKLAKYGGDRGSRTGCRRKSVTFLSLFVTLWNYEFCDNGVIFKTIMVPLHNVCSSAPIFKFKFLWTPEFSRGKFRPKNTIFGNFGGSKPTF